MNRKRSKNTQTARLSAFIRDPIWQFISVVCMVLVFFGSIVFYWYLQRPTKELRVIILTNTPLVTVVPEAANQPEIAGQIEIFYQNQPVQNISLIDVQVINNGNQPIVETDFRKAITFSFGTDFKIVNFDVVESNPSNITNIRLNKVSSHEIELSPILLNPTDWIRVRFVVINWSDSKQGTNFHVDGRIVGIKQIEVVGSTEIQTIERDRIRGMDPQILLIFALVAFSLGLMLGVSLTRSTDAEPDF